MPGQLQAVQVTKQPQRIQTFLVANESFLLVNPDITNQIFIGNDQAVQPISVPALGSLTLTPDSKHDIWVSTGGANVTVNAYLMPNGSNWTPSPAQVAAQINALGLAKDTTVGGVTTAVNATPGATATQIAGSGVPLLRKTTTLGNGSALTLIPGTSPLLLTNVAVNQPSFEAIFDLWQTAASGTLPFAIIEFNWSDSATGFALASNFYVISSGNGIGNQISCYLSGPCYGDQLSVSIASLEPVINQTLQAWAINSTSHVHTVDHLYQPQYQLTAPNGFTNPNGIPANGVLFNSNPTIGINATVSRLLAVYNGVVDFFFDCAGGAANLVITITDPSGQATGTQGGEIYAHTVTAGVRDFAELALPNVPVLFNMRNVSTTATLTVTCGGTKRNY
jgi:hypothetical protein